MVREITFQLGIKYCAVQMVAILR